MTIHINNNHIIVIYININHNVVIGHLKKTIQNQFISIFIRKATQTIVIKETETIPIDSTHSTSTNTINATTNALVFQDASF